MKIHMDMDLTPDEARSLFGLPDVKPMQKALMGKIEARMKKALIGDGTRRDAEDVVAGGHSGFGAVAEVHLVADDRGRRR